MHWAERLFYDLKITDILLTIFTGALAVYTYCLWKSTDKLWVAGETQIGIATNAANAAMNSADIAREALTKLERAFVFVKEFSRDDVRGPNKYSSVTGIQMLGDLQGYRMCVILENSGRTPANRLIYNIATFQFTDGLEDGFNFSDSAESYKAVLGPGATLITKAFFLSLTTITQVEIGNYRYLLYGSIDYDDVFAGTERHRTEFCYELVVNKVGEETHSAFVPYPEFNAVDGDCRRPPKAYA